MENVELTTEELEVKRIIEIVCTETGIQKEELKNRNRKLEIAIARHVSIYFCYISKIGSLKFIGKNFGGRDHTTIINSIRATEDFYYTNDQFRKNLHYLCDKINPELNSKLEQIRA